MRLATRYADIHAAGAEVIAVSVDDDTRQAGMARRWGLTHTRLVSDPDGEHYLKPLGLFDPEERDGIALPALLIVDPGGAEVYRYEGRDFADRTKDDDLLTALGALDLPPVDPGPWVPEVEVPSDLRGFFRPDDLRAYFNGNMFGAVALAGRITDPESRHLVHEHRVMARSSLEAWEQWRPTIT